MADTWREKAIVEAILIIADKKIANAGYDKTIKAVVNKILDKTTGKYQIKYQDSLFEAYATNANINYLKDDVVSVLIPGNDWSRTKTILSGVSNYATTYQQIPVASLQYNQIGINGISLKKKIELSSYVDQSIIIDSSHTTYGNLLDIAKYIKKGDSIALSMVVRTALESGQQINGVYGLNFNLKFADTTTTSSSDYIVKTFTVDTSDVIGNPYGLTAETLVETLITGVDTLNFISIDSIEVFCNNFPQDSSKSNIKDIIISSIGINGAAALTEEDLSGYVLHLNYSKNGNTLPQTGNPSELEVVALLKVNGKIITSDVTYYWFRQNGNIFLGDSRYSGFAGDGWECLNYFANKTPVGLTNSSYFFNRTGDDFTKSKALANQRTTKILCVAVYKNLWIKGLTLIINMAARQVEILSSDLIDGVNKTEYYLNNGSPSFVCKIDGSLTPPSTDYKYTWSFRQSKGKTQKINPNSTASTDPYLTAYNNYQNQLNIVSKMAKASADTYKQTSAYTTPINTWNNNFKGKEYIYRNKYYNFPIKKILNLGVVSCAVYNGNNYVGTASITLYNRQVLEGTYSLNILNGVQIFQYDEKGNSPFAVLIDRKAILGNGPASLGFTLLDNTGQLITYEQIIANGYVKWLFPGYDTLLVSNLGNPSVSYDSTTATAADRALAAGLYNIYNNKETFSYSIVPQYKLSSVNNTIKLVVKYNNIIIESYTDFTFPKNGDPGTNGTDLVAKLVPYNSNSQVNSDRIYAHRISSSNQGFYTDSGSAIDRLKFFVYNNNKQVYDSASFWSCPPKTTSSDKDKTANNFITINSSTGVLTLGTSPSITRADVVSKKPIHIVRGKKTITNGSYAVDYMAEYPICYVYTSGNFRIKVKPKTGFKYVVYQLDGTKPDYDNQPFELIIEKRDTISNTVVWTTSGVGTVTATWYSISGIKSISPQSGKTYIATVVPAETFDGSDLTCAIVAEVSVGGSSIGFIHIPIYRLINKYGHNALNGWDGNSIQLNANGDTILAPQVGAGKKLSDNTFTGILMGDVKTNSSTDTGMMGYYKGQRSIFLDSKTGSAIFGKQGSGQIKIDPSLVVRPGSTVSWDNAKLAGLLYSSNYTLPTTTSISSGSNAGKKGITLSVDTYRPTSSGGMVIDLSTPQLGFGSGRFYVTKEGNLHAGGGGDIAGWTISDTTLYKHTSSAKTGMQSSGDPAFYAGTTAQSAGNYNFYVNHNGYLFSKSGKIASWDISEKRLSTGSGNSSIGMGIERGQDTTFAYASTTTTIPSTAARFWSGTSFIVTNAGKLYSNSAQIGPWSVNNTSFTNGNTGLGSNTITTTDMNNAFGIGTASDAVQARIWASTAGTNASINFVVSNDGKLYSKAGKLGGWNIEKDKLWAVNSNTGEGIRLYALGSMSGGSTATTGNWAIYKNGSSSFDHITANNMTATTVDATDIITHNLTANDGGEIANWTINEKSLSCGSNNDTITISSNGSIYAGSGNNINWQITKDGDGYFKNLYGTVKSGQSLSGSGMGIGGSGGSYVNPYGVAGGAGFGTLALQIEELSVNKLKAASFTLGGYSCAWRSVLYVRSVTPNIQNSDYVTIRDGDGNVLGTALNNITLQVKTGYIYALCGQQDNN